MVLAEGEITRQEFFSPQGEIPNLPFPQLPRTFKDLYARAMDSGQIRRDRILSDRDDALSQQRIAELLVSNVYQGKHSPTGTGSVMTIPGYFCGETHYLYTTDYMSKLGHTASVMPTIFGANIAPARIDLQRRMDAIKRQTDMTGQKTTLLTISKSGVDAEVMASECPEFADHVERVFKVGSPDEIDWINTAVLCRPNVAAPLITERDLLVHEEFAGSLQRLGIPTISFLNPSDLLVRGKTHGPVIETDDPHRGGLFSVATLNRIDSYLPHTVSRQTTSGDRLRLVV